MLLITEPFAGQDFDAFDFEIVAFVEHRKRAPGAPIEFWRIVDGLR
jgi:hypothetical protein